MKLHSLFRGMVRGIHQIIFPPVCLACGQEPMGGDHYICPFCLQQRFAYAGSTEDAATSDIILPDGIDLQHALWMFDKGGILQDLMHHLKYEGLTGLGWQMGTELGRRLGQHTALSAINPVNMVLLPVPLHYLKYRKRGFNQAFCIAQGIAQVLGVPIVPIGAVRRQKYTATQTGFTLERRIENMDQAFTVPRPQAVAGKKVVIIDDVFTTGATTFELARVLQTAGTAAVMIATVAQA